MGKEIVYCGGCGKSLREEEFARGKAHTVENRPYCVSCKPLPAPLPTPATPAGIKISSSPLLPKTTPRGHTRRVEGEDRPAPPRKALAATIAASAGALLLLFLWLLFTRQAPPAPSAKPAAAGAPAAPPAAKLPPVAEAPRPPPPPPAPTTKDLALAVRELETFAGSSSDLDAVLQRCQELCGAVKGTPHEATLLALERRTLDARKARDQDAQLTRTLAEVRKLIDGEQAVARREEIHGLLNAVRAIAGDRRGEVDRLSEELEKKLKESAARPPPPAPAPPPPAAPAMAVTGFTLINADTNQPVAGFDPIPPGAVIPLATLGTRNLNIRANVTPAQVGCVRFTLDGAVFSLEANTPYALAGNVGSKYGAWTPAPGAHTLTATPFALANAGGAAGTPCTITFQIVDPAAPAETSLSFQDGVSPAPTYAGTRDTELSEVDPTGTAGTAKRLEADGSENSGKNRSVLLRWDLSAIPPGSLVRSASLTLHIVGSGTKTPYPFHEVKRDWVEREACWSQASAGKPWEAPGAKGAQDRGAVAATLPPSKGGPVTIALDAAVVQGWVNRPAANFGLILANPDSSDGVQVASREASSPAERPRLTVAWSNAGGPAPAGVADLDATGSVPHWLVLGPFGNRRDPSGLFDHDLLRGEATHVPAVGAEVTTREGTKVRWTPYVAPEGKLLFYDLEGFAPAAVKRSPAIAFAACWLEVETAQEVKLRINADQGYRFWVDQKRHASETGGHGMAQEAQIVRANLSRGAHLVLVKVATPGASFGLRLRVTTASGDKAPGVRVWNQPPAAPAARKALFAEDFNQGRGKFKDGEVVDGGVDGSKALSLPKAGAWISEVFPSPVSPTLTVRVKVKPLFGITTLEAVLRSAKHKENCWYHVRGLKRGEWNPVEFKVAEARVGYKMDGPSLEGDAVESLKFYFDDGGPDARVLIDDFEVLP